jgi:C4-type Zn-finger protein
MCVGLWSGCDFTPCVTLYRDVLKSDSAMVSIPELDLELGHGTLGGVFTTVEGLLMKIHKALQDNNPFAVGDSATQHHSNKAEQTEIKAKFKVFLGKLEDFAKGVVLPFTLIVRDPLGNSFISAPLGSFLPPEMDKNITMTDFGIGIQYHNESIISLVAKNPTCEQQRSSISVGSKTNSFIRPR